ncbi:MAG: ATP-binding protein [Lutisporaceae bacterium]
MKSISFKLWGLMLSLVFTALILIWFFQIVFLESFYFNMHEKKLLNEGNYIVSMILENQTENKIMTKIEELLLKYNARIDIYTPAGIVIYSNENAPKIMEADRTAILIELGKGNTVVNNFKDTRFGSNILIIGLPAIQNNKLKAALIMSVPLASVKETVATLKEQLLIISIILIGLSAILSYWFSRFFTKPILEINKAAKTMAEGNLSIKVAVNTKDELGMLSSTINHLSSQLQKIEQLRKELIANVSHEFRTPLSLIKGYAETIRDVKGLSAEKKDKQLNIIIEESDKLNSMINDILDLSQIQSNYYILEMSDFRIGETIEAVETRLQYLIEEKGLCVKANFDPEILIYGDERRIEQVLFNLLNNAINHSKEGDVIKLRVVEHDSVAVVEVVDQGDGIASQDISYIWDRFYKVHNGQSNKRKGSGLGLAIVKSILEAHKSNFGVESEIGKGSKFWFEVKKSAKYSAL